MPQIIVAADRGAAFGDGAVTFRETVNVADFESQHFATQLVERIGWAVEDADQVERVSGLAKAAEPIEADAVEELAEVRAEPAPEPQPDERVIVQTPA
jgi:hypothetical protein